VVAARPRGRGWRIAGALLALAVVATLGAGVFLSWHLDLAPDEVVELALDELSDPFGPTRKRARPAPRESPWVVPSPGLRNCRVLLSAYGNNQVSLGSHEQPGHFIAIAGHGDRVVVTLACPACGRVEPAAHRSDSTTTVDQFHWEVAPDHSSTTLKLRWLHPRGDQDEVVLHWEVRQR
jgi:hypothetical protein